VTKDADRQVAPLRGIILTKDADRQVAPLRGIILTKDADRQVAPLRGIILTSSSVVNEQTPGLSLCCYSNSDCGAEHIEGH
jgi:hypothetical protein